MTAEVGVNRILPQCQKSWTPSFISELIRWITGREEPSKPVLQASQFKPVSLMESNLFPPKVTKALQAADRRDARESGGTCPSDCLVSSATQVKHLAFTLLLSPFPRRTAFGQHAILEPYNWMLEIKRCWPGNRLYSACKGKTQGAPSSKTGSQRRRCSGALSP